MTNKENNQEIAAQIAQATFDLNAAVAQVNDRLGRYYTSAINGEFIQAAGARDRLVGELVDLNEQINDLLLRLADIKDVKHCSDNDD